MINIIIRKETKKDYEMSEFVTEEAFKNEEHSEHNEKEVVIKLRKSNVFIPELSLVAELDKRIVGYIMFTKLFIRNGEKEYVSLALAPVSVLPEYQNKGIGSKLILEGLKIAKEIGFGSVIVLGHEKFYPRFGFKPASLWEIKSPFDIPDELFMALELKEKALEGISGEVVYAREFFE